METLVQDEGLVSSLVLPRLVVETAEPGKGLQILLSQMSARLAGGITFQQRANFVNVPQLLKLPGTESNPPISSGNKDAFHFQMFDHLPDRRQADLEPAGQNVFGQGLMTPEKEPVNPAH